MFGNAHRHRGHELHFRSAESQNRIAEIYNYETIGHRETARALFNVWLVEYVPDPAERNAMAWNEFGPHGYSRFIQQYIDLQNSDVEEREAQRGEIERAARRRLNPAEDEEEMNDLNDL